MSEDIFIRKSGYTGHITLNRPDVLNSLTYSMILAIEKALDEWETDDHRTALITDPSTGRLPAMLESRREELASRERHRDYARGPEDRTMMERCIWAPQSVPPIKTLIENAMLQLVLTQDYAVIQTERMHDSRIVPLDNRPSLPFDVKQYYGSSKGYWEEDKQHG